MWIWCKVLMDNEKICSVRYIPNVGDLLHVDNKWFKVKTVDKARKECTVRYALTNEYKIYA